jgi:Mg/Co/Ni transporter MgtE
MEERVLLEEYFGKQLREYLADNPERAQELYLRLKSLSASEEWRVFQKIIEDTRERVIQNFENSPTQLETLIAYRESLSALDFLRNLPENLMRVIELEFTDLTRP